MSVKKGKPLSKQRHCSICGLPGHTKAAHRKKTPALRTRKPARRRNVDFFSDGAGAAHPIRDSYGYREWATNSEKGQRMKAALRRGKRR